MLLIIFVKKLWTCRKPSTTGSQIQTFHRWSFTDVGIRWPWFLKISNRKLWMWRGLESCQLPKPLLWCGDPSLGLSTVGITVSNIIRHCKHAPEISTILVFIPCCFLRQDPGAIDPTFASDLISGGPAASSEPPAPADPKKKAKAKPNAHAKQEPGDSSAATVPKAKTASQEAKSVHWLK